jgi:hypothetical protein
MFELVSTKSCYLVRQDTYISTVVDGLRNRRYITLSLPHNSASQVNALVYQNAFCKLTALLELSQSLHFEVVT